MAVDGGSGGDAHASASTPDSYAKPTASSPSIKSEHTTSGIKRARPIPPGASAVHHIVDEDVKNAPPLGDVIERFKGADFYVAHNAEFEQSFFAAQGIPTLVPGSAPTNARCAFGRGWTATAIKSSATPSAAPAPSRASSVAQSRRTAPLSTWLSPPRCSRS